MNTYTSEALDFLQKLKGESGPCFTHAMKEYAGGDNPTMVDGAIRMVEQIKRENDSIISVTKIKYFGLGIGSILTVQLLCKGVRWAYSKCHAISLESEVSRLTSSYNAAHHAAHPANDTCPTDESFVSDETNLDIASQDPVSNHHLLAHVV